MVRIFSKAFSQELNMFLEKVERLYSFLHFPLIAVKGIQKFDSDQMHFHHVPLFSDFFADIYILCFSARPVGVARATAVDIVLSPSNQKFQDVYNALAEAMFALCPKGSHRGLANPCCGTTLLLTPHAMAANRRFLTPPFHVVVAFAMSKTREGTKGDISFAKQCEWCTQYL